MRVPLRLVTRFARSVASFPARDVPCVKDGTNGLLGRPLLMRYGRYVLITPDKIEKAHAWAEHYGTMGVFISRLLPVIRHLIGIPAGIVRLNFWWYSLATVAGSALWCSVLAWVGVTAGQDPEVLLAGSVHRISLWVGGLGAFLGLLYWVFVHRHMRR